MSWMQRLCETYDACFGQPQFESEPTKLAPVSSIPQKTQLHVTLNADGSFSSAALNELADTTMFVTEDSAGRSGTDPAANPLIDQLEYCAKGLARFGGNPDKYERFVALLEQWQQSGHADHKVSAVLNYVKAGTMLDDLLRENVLTQEGDGLVKIKVNKTLKLDPVKLWVRWSVISDDLQTDTWSDLKLAQQWAAFDLSLDIRTQICMLSGERVRTTQKHPKRLRSGGDNAKLVSANDSKNYTFRGRFTTSEAALSIGYITTQKAHNALRWLIARQGVRSDEQVVVAWAVQTAEPLPVIVATSDLPWLADEVLPDGNTSDLTTSYEGDAGQFYANQLSKAIRSYQAKLGERTDMVVMALDSATPGRMAIPYYRELNGSEFLARIKKWHLEFAWFQDYGFGRRFLGVPSLRDIAEAAYGRRDGERLRVDDKLLRATVERLLPCIVDSRPLPRDLERTLVRRASSRAGMKDWEFERILGIACSLVRGSNPKEQYRMSLDDKRNKRDYLYGRLLAVADNIEELAHIVAKEERETNAMRLMQRFADHPFATWRTIELQLLPYLARLRGSRFAGALSIRKDLLDDLLSRLTSLGEGVNSPHDKQLSGEFLLGYHSQRKELRRKKNDNESAKEEQDQTEGENL